VLYSSPVKNKQGRKNEEGNCDVGSLRDGGGFVQRMQDLPLPGTWLQGLRTSVTFA